MIIKKVDYTPPPPVMYGSLAHGTVWRYKPDSKITCQKVVLRGYHGKNETVDVDLEQGLAYTSEEGDSLVYVFHTTLNVSFQEIP
jgi:hypothetical protein